LEFKQPSGTSRGVLRTKESWFLELREVETGKKGIGECSVIKGLSPDYKGASITATLDALCQSINKGVAIGLDSPLFKAKPAVKFCYEMAVKDIEAKQEKILFDTEFIHGKGLPINGLVWMGSKSFMNKQIKEKINAGFKCIKIKIAAIDFEEECTLLDSIRKEYSKDDIIIRVDANGGFGVDEALEKLKRLSDYELHSIEQPIMAGQGEDMAQLCVSSPIAIALDEELIGINDDNTRHKLLADISPQFVILKPSLVGGFADAEAWINHAANMDIGWWVTSALESNIGLNAIAQWTASLGAEGFQGLGTGQLYTNNVESPLYIHDGSLFYGGDEWAEV